MRENVFKPETELIFVEVQAERDLQDLLWGVQEHPPFMWLSILGEEFGEVCKAANESALRDYRSELVQVAAVAVAAIEAYDRATGYDGEPDEEEDEPKEA